MSNPFAALIDDNNKPSTAPPAEIPVKDDELCHQLQNIFGFTLDNTKSTNQHYVYLEDQASMFPGRSLDVEILEHALFERLFLQSPIDYVQDKKHKDAYEEFYQGEVITYLYTCFKRNFDVKTSAGVCDSVQSLILRNVLTALKQPDLYSEQNLYVQFIEILKECLPLHEEFFAAVYKAFVQDEDGLEVMKEFKLMAEIYENVVNGEYRKSHKFAVEFKILPNNSVV